MIAVGIETSGPSGSVAIVRDDVCLAQRTLSRTGRRHARTLVVELQQLLQSVRVIPARVDVVAVSVGPGSFTGLRVGVVCAKTMAYAIPAELIPVGTFDAVARNAAPDVPRQYVIGDAQRGDVFVARYCRSAGGRWEQVSEIQIAPFESWCDELPADAIISGPGAEVHRGQLEQRARLLERACWTPLASQVACIGLELAAMGISEDPSLIEPIYIRKSSAEEKFELRSAEKADRSEQDGTAEASSL